MRKTSPSIVSIHYDRSEVMSPSLNNNNNNLNNAANYYDNQHISLFGDPVPPAARDFMDNIDNHLYSSLRRNSLRNSTTSCLMDEFPRYNSFTPQRGNPPSSPSQITSANLTSQSPAIIQHSPPKIYSGGGIGGSRQYANVTNLGPKIKILPNSSSSSGHQTPIMKRNQNNNPQEPIEVDSDMIFEPHLMNYDWKNKDRRSSQLFEEDFSNFSRPRNPSQHEISTSFSTFRRLSNDSYSSAEWFKPSHDYQEWSRIPKLRPSSKNVMSINQQHIQRQSPVAALIHDSNDSSSSGDKEPPPPITNLRQSQSVIRPKTAPRKTDSEPNLHVLEELPPTGLPPTGTSMKRELSPVIITNAIATGSDYRIDPPRSHKKTSFTIIAERSPQNSRASSPLQGPVTGRISPFLGHGFKEPSSSSKPTSTDHSLPQLGLPVKKSQSATTSRLRLPVIGSGNNLNTSDDSPRPSVQFNMSSSPGRSFSAIPRSSSKGILHHKATELSSQLPIGKPFPMKQKVGSLEALPKVFGTSGTLLRPIPKRLNKSSLDIYAADDKPEVQQKRPPANQNPTSRQRGLLRVISSADSSSKIPVRTDLTTSLDDVRFKRKSSLSPIRTERRTGSTSPERRSSTQTEPKSSTASDRRSSNLSSITTSDFSFRRNSGPAPPTIMKTSRRQSIFQPQPTLKPNRSKSKTKFEPRSVKSSSARSPRKVAKPTTLSPIIGTPNKEAQLSSEEIENLSPREKKVKTPTSKIPTLGGSRSSSRVNSRSNSRGPSLANSRSNSPFKDYLPVSRPNSRAASRSSSRAASRTPSRSNSRPASRASLKTDSKIQSRSNSRLSFRGSSPPKTRSPARTRKKSPTKYKSPSPKRTRRKSISLNSSPIRSRSKSKERSSRSPKRSFTKGKEISNKRGSPKRSNIRKEITSAKNTPTNVRKRDFSIKKKSSPSPTAARKQTPSKKDTNLSRSNSNIKKTLLNREQSSLKKKSNTTKEQSNNSKKETPLTKRESSSMLKNSPSLKRISSNQKIETSIKQTPLMKKRTESDLKKRLEKKNSFKNKKESVDVAESKESSPTQVAENEVQTEQNINSDEAQGKLIPLTKANVVSMTTAAITAQPVQITTAVTNQAPLNKTNSSGQLNAMSENEDGNKDMLPVAILEKSQKTLETIQKTVTVATDEIHKTINENLTDLKTLETEVGKIVEGTGVTTMNPLEKSESLKAILEKTQQQQQQQQQPPSDGSDASKKANDTFNELTTSSGSTTGGNNAQNKSPAPPSQPIEAEVSVITQKKSSSDNLLQPGGNGNNQMSGNTSSTSDSENHHMMNPDKLREDMAERVSERAISVLPEVECESANLQSTAEQQQQQKQQQQQQQKQPYTGEETVTTRIDEKKMNTENNNEPGESGDGSSTAKEAKESKNNEQGSNSQEYLDEDIQPTTCCGRSKCSRCCSKICIPCRRCKCSPCCRKKSDMETAAVLGTTTSNMQSPDGGKQSCWQKMNCCKKKNPNNNTTSETMLQQKHMETINEEPEVGSSSSTTQIDDVQSSMKQNKCRLCLSKFFCCRSTNKVNTITGETQEIKKCCFCIPCKSKKKEQTLRAWQQQQQEQQSASVVSEQPEQRPRGAKFLEKLMCWKKKPQPADSRRESLKATLPPEDTRPRLHVDLVEFNSKMKGAIPVMPLWLAWFCMICNCLCPGLGTVFSGFFCLCVGIPRFSQYDSMKARIGSLIINCIVGAAQLFCVLFCFVGWGWSVWWGTIMLKTARKLKKIKRVEQLELEEEQRQAAMAAAAAAAEQGQGQSVVNKDRDVEAGKT